MNGAARSAVGWREKLRTELGSAVTFDAPLAPLVAFRIGGPADALVRALSVSELERAIRIAEEEGVPVTVLGTGANVLVSDLGVRGIVLRLAGELSEIHVARVASSALLSEEEEQVGNVEVGAGALNATLVALLLNLDLVGLEFLATIPGTFGGALVMNAGAYGWDVGAFVKSVEVLRPDLGREVRTPEACGFGYRTSRFLPGEVLLSACLEVPPGDAAEARRTLRELRARRRASQPSDFPNAGSIFKNPPGDYAGRLIEAAGLKGASVGAALVSPVHANFIVNRGGATARDVVTLAETVMDAVRAQFGIALEWEVRRIGEFPPAVRV